MVLSGLSGLKNPRLTCQKFDMQAKSQPNEKKLSPASKMTLLTFASFSPSFNSCIFTYQSNKPRRNDKAPATTGRPPSQQQRWLDRAAGPPSGCSSCPDQGAWQRLLRTVLLRPWKDPSYSPLPTRHGLDAQHIVSQRQFILCFLSGSGTYWGVGGSVTPLLYWGPRPHPNGAERGLDLCKR